MANPTVTNLTSFTDAQRASNGQQLQPSDAYRITGGTADDRLTMDEIVADSTIATLLSYDADTGVVKRVGASPTPYTFIFGSGAPLTTVAAGSSGTTLNVADATGFTDTGRVRINNGQEHEIDSISGNAITLATAMSPAPNTGQRVKFLEADDSITPDCYLELVGITFDLESNAGTDTSAQDLGNETDKIVFSDYCDVVIGSDVGDPNVPDAGNCAIVAENFSWNFYNFVEVFQEGTKVTCNGYMAFIMKGNSRPSLVNRNSTSKIRAIVAAHSVSPFADNFRCGFDLDVESQEILMYGGRASFRPSLVPGGIQSDEFVLPAAVAASGGSVYLYWQDAPFASTGYTVRGLQTITEVGAAEQPQVDVQSADGPGTMLVILAEFGGKRADEFFRFSADDGHLTTEISQRVNFAIRDAANAAVTAEGLKVEAGSYSIAYDASPLGTPVITETEYGEVQDFDDVSDQEVEIVSKVFACNRGTNQDFRETTETSIVSQDLAPMRYSMWAWGYEVRHQVAFSLEDETGETDLVVVLPEDSLVTAATKAAVVSEAATFDDIYDLLAEYAFDNEEDIAASVDGGILTFTDADVTLADGGSLSRSSGAITIPCGSTVAAGTKITGIKATGDLTIEFGVDVTGSTEDQSGIVVVFSGLPAAHDAVVGAWPASDGESDRSNIINGHIPIIHRTDISVTAIGGGLTATVATVAGDLSDFVVGSTVKLFRFDEAANNGNFTVDSVAENGLSIVVSRSTGSFVDEAAGSNRKCISDQTSTTIKLTLDADTEYYFVGDAISYLRSTPSTFDTGDTTTVNVGLRNIQDASGNNLISAEEDLTADETERFHLIEYDVAGDVVTFGGETDNQAFTFAEVARAIEVGQSSEGALENPYVILFATGSLTLESGSDRKFQRKAGLATAIVPDLSAFQFTKVGSNSVKDIVDFDNGAIIVNNGNPSVVSLSVQGTDEGDFHGYLDSYDIETDVPLKKALQIMLGVGIGRVDVDPNDSTMLRVYRAVDDSHIATVNIFGDDNTRAAGAVQS